MALKDTWKNLVDGESEINASDINNIADAVIELEEREGEEDGLPPATTEGAFLRVVDGVWAESVLPNLDEEEY